MSLESPDPRDGAMTGAGSPTERAGRARPGEGGSRDRQPRVVVADDLATMRQLLALLASRAGFDVVAEVGTTDALAEAVDRLAPDVAFTDVEMPGTPLVEVLGTLRERARDIAVLVHTGHADGASVKRLTAAGAREVIAKGSPVEHILAVLRAAVDGGAGAPPAGGRAVADREG